ncbi:cation:proton antiporter [Azospirillum soli]|uniref:cation:proton antiporter n=1 Tax=Azospirillum soli TaxID=1304799 RepID=UPI001AEADF54|nr:cation:proton antiporter [Azospirillum soli]MBP2315023.1 NhaP-type Na+/H+ or K+/H+ antiporter [Azospirillum soli]
MSSYIVALVCVGFLILLVAWLPMLLKELPLSLPIVCVVFGFLVFQAAGLETPDPLKYPVATERLTELIVLVALMGAGLKLDRVPGWRSWMVTWRLLGITMPLSILLIALIGWGVLGLPVPVAVLLGAALAPTDPVLASDVQVGPPKSGEEDDIRFSLTSEAGLNDGLAFPFTNLAIAKALYSTTPGLWTLEWLGIDVVWKLAAGVGVGWLVGKALGIATFRLPNRAKLSRTGDGFVSLGITLIAYGVTELAHGYGFLAVFVAALSLRHEERNHEYHEKLHDFIEQTERLLMMLLLVLFGGALARGLLIPLTWTDVIATILILFAVRPLAGLAGLWGMPIPLGEKLAIGFFGIRGMGSFYYLAFALNNAHFGVPNQLWAVIGFVVLVSIVVHGTTVTPVMRALDHARRRGNQREAAAGGHVLGRSG